MVDELVSIVMPMKNAARTLDAAIRSVVQQSWSQWELLIVDDLSSDDSLSRARQWAVMEPRIRVIASRVALGPAAARNLALHQATGRYLAFLDADDLWASEKLQIQLETMRTTGSPLAFSSYAQFHDGAHEGWVYQAPSSTTYADMLGGNVIGCLTVVIDRSMLKALEFDDGRDVLPRTPWRHLYSLIGHEDYVAWMRALQQIESAGWPPPVGIPQPLAYHRLSPGSFSSSKIRVAGYQWFIYRHMLMLSCWRSLYCFARYASRSLGKRFDRRYRLPIPGRV